MRRKWPVLLLSLALHTGMHCRSSAGDAVAGFQYGASFPRMTNCWRRTIKGFGEGLSDVLFHPDGQRLIIVENHADTNYFVVTDLDGKNLYKVDLPGFTDSEGMCHVSNDVFAIVDEFDSDITLFSLPTNDAVIPKSSCPSYYISIPAASNAGVEGVAFDAGRNCFYLGMEPMTVYRIELVAPSGTTATLLFDQPGGFGGMCGDLHDIEYNPATDHFLVLSELTQRTVECDLSGNLKGLLETSGTSLEGLALSPGGDVFCTLEQYALLSRYAIASSWEWFDESEPNPVIAVELEGGTGGTASVSYTVQPLTAAGGGTDFTLPGGTLTFNAGETLKTIPFAITPDCEPEGLSGEQFAVTLVSASNAVLSGPACGRVRTCVIRDDDTPFTAYNDLGWMTGERSGRITTYTRGDAGRLKDYSLDTHVAAMLSVGSGGLGPFDQGEDADPYTDAWNVFAGRVSGRGLISYDQTNDRLTLTFSGLSTSLWYNVTLFGNRGVTNYTNRLTKTEIGGAAHFVNASTPGAGYANSDSEYTVIANGCNTAHGYAARFTNVDPGGDGQFVLTVSDGGSATPPRFYANAVALEGAFRSPVGPPAAPSRLKARPGRRSCIELSWRRNGVNETAFVIERRALASPAWAQVGMVGPYTTNYTDTGVSPERRYYYRIKARHWTLGDSAYCAEAGATTLGATAFMAYNDLSWHDLQKKNRITAYTTGAGPASPPDGNSGFLVDCHSGAVLPARLTVTGGRLNTWDWAVGDLSGAGTEAHGLFAEAVTCQGVISYSSAPAVLTFSGLNPGDSYSVVLFGNANIPLYTNRLTAATISGADAFVNASSAGAGYSGPADPSAVTPNGINREGLVARFIDVRPGADGQFTVTVSDGGSESPPKYYVNALILENRGAAPGDADSDGVPDYWESAFGFDTNNALDAGADFDGDGSANGDEYLADTDPKDGTSCLRILSAGQAGEDFSLSFNSRNGLTYELQAGDLLNPSDWRKAREIEGNGAELSLADPFATNAPSRCYRVKGRR